MFTQLFLLDSFLVNIQVVWDQLIGVLYISNVAIAVLFFIY